MRRRLRSTEGPAIEAGDERLDWPSLAARADALDAALVAAGLGRGAVVALPGRNQITTAAACIALVATERCAAIMNPFQPALAMLAAARRAAPDALLIEERDLCDTALEPDRAVFVLDVDGRVRRHRAGKAREPQPRDDARLILSTSGTTGEPKLVTIGDAQLALAMADIIGFNAGFGDRRREDGSWAPLIQYSPLAHIGGTLTLLRATAQGRPVVLLEKFDVRLWAETLARHRPITTGLPPAMMRMVLEAELPAEALADLRSVWSGSAPVKPETTDRFTARYGIPVLGNYGATEFCGAVATWSLDDYRRFHLTRAAAVGRLHPAVAEARVRAEDDARILPLGETGVLEMRVPRVGGDWIRTTDLAHLDADGFLYLHGRADDAIVRGGFKLKPETIVATLRRHPAVRDVAVVGMKDARLGQVPVAAVEARVEVAAAELIAFARQHLPVYFAPVAIRFVDALPRTPAMKIDRRAVRRLFGP